MIARTVGELHQDSVLLQAKVENFWDGSPCSVPTGGAVWPHTDPTLKADVSFSPSGQSLAIPSRTNSINTPVNHNTISDWAAPGRLAIIEISTKTKQNSSGTEPHFMLVTGADNANSLIFAADVWTGTKVALSWGKGGMSDGQVVQIMDPADGQFYSYPALLSGTLLPSVIADFNTALPVLQDGTPSYVALQTFNMSGPHTGWTEVIIK
jgi:hypothetical protein